MIRPLTSSLLLGFLVFSLGLEPSQAFLGGIRKRSEEKKVLNAEELTTQEGKAAAALAKAQEYEQSGKTRQARDAYKGIAQNYSRTQSGATAKFGYARMLENEGDGRKAFDQYQELVTNYRNSPDFNEAVRRQFEIAEGLRQTKKKGFLGIGAAIQPSKLVEMFEKISASAPFTEWSPKSLLNIGYIRTEIGETDPAIASFRQVVDKYPDTEFAKEAQYQIFKLRGVSADKSNSPLKDRAHVEAGLDFVNQNPEDQRAAEVKDDMRQVEEKSMEKLYETGKFYEKSGKPEAARIYYREVVKNPNTSWAAKAQERLAALDSGGTVEKKASMFGPNPLKKDKVEMRTSDDAVVPLPAGASSSPAPAPAPAPAAPGGPIDDIPSPPAR